MSFIQHFIPALRARRDECYRCAVAGDLEILRSQHSESLAKIGGEFGKLGDVDFGTQAAKVDAADIGTRAGINDLRKSPIRAGECGNRKVHDATVFISRGQFVKGCPLMNDSAKRADRGFMVAGSDFQ